MFIDTVMALWNRILYGKLNSTLKRVFVTSFLFGIGLVLLLIMIGVPLLSHSSPVIKHTIQSVDVANKKEEALLPQPHLDGLSTPPPTPTMIPTPAAAIPTANTFFPTAPNSSELATEVPVPAKIGIMARPVPVNRSTRVAAQHQTALHGRKDASPTATPLPVSTPTKVFVTPVTVVTPTPALLPTPTMMPIESAPPAPAASPAPDFIGTAQARPPQFPTMIATPTSSNLAWMNF